MLKSEQGIKDLQFLTTILRETLTSLLSPEVRDVPVSESVECVRIIEPTIINWGLHNEIMF